MIFLTYAVQINRSRCHYIIPIRPSPSSLLPILSHHHLRLSTLRSISLAFPPVSNTRLFFLTTIPNLYQHDWRQIRRQGQRRQDVAIVSFSSLFCLFNSAFHKLKKKARLFFYLVDTLALSHHFLSLNHHTNIVLLKSLIQSWSRIPSWSCPSSLAKRQLCSACRCR